MCTVVVVVHNLRSVSTTHCKGWNDYFEVKTQVQSRTHPSSCWYNLGSLCQNTADLHASPGIPRSWILCPCLEQKPTREEGWRHNQQLSADHIWLSQADTCVPAPCISRDSPCRPKAESSHPRLGTESSEIQLAHPARHDKEWSAPMQTQVP